MVYEIVKDTCKILVEQLLPEVMSLPTEKKWKEIADEFWSC